MGRKDIAATTLEWLATVPSVEIAGVLTDGHLKGSPTQLAAERLGYDTYSFEGALAALRGGELTYDLGISILYWRKLIDEFITIPSKGVINFHPAPLPDYKGTGGYNFAILDGCATWGVSAHYVDENIDTGPIIEVSRFPIDRERETCVSIESKTRKALRALIHRIITRVAIHGKELPRQPNVGGRYITRREMEAAKRILPGDDVGRKVRAFWFPPYDGAYIEIDGQCFTLVSREILSTLQDDGMVTPIDAVAETMAMDDPWDGRIVRPGDDVDAKVRALWNPPDEGACVVIDGVRYTLVNSDILATLAPEGTTTLFPSHFAPLV